MRPPTRRRASSASSSSAGPATKSRGTTNATCGGTTSWKPRPTSASPSAWGPKTRSSSSTPRGRPRSRRASQHTSAGYLLHVAVTHKWIFDIHDDTIWWCAADVGWVTGHSYIVYGPLANGTTSVLYEGDPAYPDWDRHWEIVERYKVNSYYTAPTLIRSFVKMGDGYPARHDLSSLRLLGTVGEPINPEAWVWYWKVIGQERCPVVDTWWQTETGGILITPLPGLTTLKPGSATVPFPGIKPAILDEQGDPVPQGQGGFLTVKHPWPGMFRTLWEDDERYVSNYFSKYGPETYFTGDGAKQDSDGYFWLMGRIDDVINVAGHRLSTTEIESTLVEHEAVAEAATLRRLRPRPWPVASSASSSSRRATSRRTSSPRSYAQFVAAKIGKIARPAAVLFGDDLPEDPLGEDHAPPPEGHRRGSRARGHDDAARRGRRRRPQAEGRLGAGASRLGRVQPAGEGAEAFARSLVGPERGVVGELRVGGDVTRDRADLVLDRLSVRRVGQELVDPGARALVRHVVIDEQRAEQDPGPHVGESAKGELPARRVDQRGDLGILRLQAGDELPDGLVDERKPEIFLGHAQSLVATSGAPTRQAEPRPPGGGRRRASRRTPSLSQVASATPPATPPAELSPMTSAGRQRTLP